MESSPQNKSVLNFNEKNKREHCIELYAILKSYKQKVNFAFYENNQVMTYSKLFDVYYTHCESDSKN